MCSALAKDFAKKFGGAIGDLVRFGEAGSAVHEYRHLDDPLHLVQVAKGRLQRGEDFDGDVARGLPALRSCDLFAPVCRRMVCRLSWRVAPTDK